MSEGLNKVILVGNLGADPELKVLASGQAVLNIRMATSESYVDRENTRQERTEWHSVVVWGKRGEALARILGKGDRLCVEGKLQTQSYEKDGEKRYRTQIVATNVYLCGGGRSEGAGERRPTRERQQSMPDGGSTTTRGAYAPPVPTRSTNDDFGDYGAKDDDIPF